MIACPNCWAEGARPFHGIRGVPVNSCLLFETPAEAIRIERGDIELAFCPTCSFVFNAAWRPERTTYSERYEETQAFSPTFNEFHASIAEELIGRYGIIGKEIVEIGCGKGEFLTLLCKLGANRGVGYDPSFVPERRQAGTDRISFRQEFFSGATQQAPVDLVCCKMTLEHIFETRQFLLGVRRIVSRDRGTVAFFQVPDVQRILTEGAFWDVYYEHCCYFSRPSLEYLFRSTGFEVLRVSSGFDNQYLTIEAQAADRADSASTPDKVKELESCVTKFSTGVSQRVNEWRSLLSERAAAGGRTVLWGSGSKAVAFLSALGLDHLVEYLVDINPHRHGRFVPGTGKAIVSPQFLASYQPDLVVAMNPVYLNEIARDLRAVGCEKAILCSADNPAGRVVGLPAGLLKEPVRA
jgi:hypothetical protein